MLFKKKEEVNKESKEVDQVDEKKSTEDQNLCSSKQFETKISNSDENKKEKDDKESKDSKKPKSKVKKVFNWIFGIVTGLLIVFAATFGIISLTSKKDNYGVPNFFGNQILLVLTDSMEPEIKTGSAVISKKVEASTIEVGDVVTFFYPSENRNITHKVTDIEFRETDNKYWFRAHGVNTQSNQGPGGTIIDLTNIYQEFNEDLIIGKVVYVSETLGNFYSFMMNGYGILVIIGIPCAYLIIVSVIDIIKAVKDDDEDDEDNKPSSGSGSGSLKDLPKADRERLKQELLEKLIEDKRKGADK